MSKPTTSAASRGTKAAHGFPRSLKTVARHRQARKQGATAVTSVSATQETAEEARNRERTTEKCQLIDEISKRDPTVSHCRCLMTALVSLEMEDRCFGGTPMDALVSDILRLATYGNGTLAEVEEIFREFREEFSAYITNAGKALRLYPELVTRQSTSGTDCGDLR